MKILFDHQIFVYQNFGGISRYFVELAKRMAPKASYTFSILLSDNTYLRKTRLSSSISLLKGRFPGRMTLYNLINKIFSRLCISHQKYDLFHATYYDDYFLDIKRKKPFVLTVHDMIHELYPGLWGNQEETVLQKKKLILESDGIIAVSENTKKDLLAIYPEVAPDKIAVIYHGHSVFSKTYGPAPLSFPYLLYVGIREHYKNFLLLTEAFKKLTDLQPHLILLCAGGGEFSEAEMQHLQQLGISDKILHTPISDDLHLSSLYHYAVAFVYPSLYEGFGIPILEAFANDCPVALSKSSCFPEVAGEAAAYFDGHSALSITETLYSLIVSQDKRERLKVSGKEKLKQYSWDTTTTKTLAFYESILSKKAR